MTDSSRSAALIILRRPGGTSSPTTATFRYTGSGLLRVAATAFMVALCLTSAFGQQITEDTLIDADTTILSMNVHAGVTLTLGSNAVVTIESGGYGLSTTGGTIEIRPGAVINLYGGGIDIKSDASGIGRLNAEGAVIRTMVESLWTRIAITGAYGRIVGCTLDRINVGLKESPISGPEMTDTDLDYDIQITGNKISSSFRSGVVGLGHGRILFSGNEVTYDVPSGTSRSVALFIATNGAARISSNTIRLDGEYGASALTAAADDAAAHIEIVDNDVIDLRSGAISAGISVAGCTADNTPVVVRDNTVVNLALPLSGSGCNVSFTENVAEGRGRQGYGNVVRLVDTGGEFRGNEIRDYAVIDAVQNNRGRIMYVSGTRPLRISNNVFANNGLVVSSALDFRFTLVHLESATEVAGNEFVSNTLSTTRHYQFEPAVLSIENFTSDMLIEGNLFRDNTFVGENILDETGARGTLLYTYLLAPFDSMIVGNNFFDGSGESVVGLHMAGDRGAYDHMRVLRNTFQDNRVGAYTTGTPNFGDRELPGGNVFLNSESYHLRRSLDESRGDTLFARSNDWGTLVPLEIDNLIFDDEEANKVNVGPVDFGDSRHEQFQVTITPSGSLEMVSRGHLELSADVRDLSGLPRQAPVQFVVETVEGEGVVVIEPWLVTSDESGRASTTVHALNIGTVRVRAHVYEAMSEALEILVRDYKRILIQDAHHESIPHTEFELYRVDNDPPKFTEVLLGSFVTDIEGRLDLEIIGRDSFLVAQSALNPQADTLESGDSLRVSRKVYTYRAKKHLTADPTAFKVYLDNAKFDGNGAMSFDAVDANAVQPFVLDHSEFRYDLVISLEWDAEPAYVNSLQASVRSASAYLYDVSDGQVRFDSVLIFEKKQHWAEADVWIRSSNLTHPSAYVNAISSGTLSRTIEIGRKWYGNAEDGINLSERERQQNGQLDLNTKNHSRTLVHELGHYALGLWDEYLYWDPNTQDYTGDRGLRCPGASAAAPTNFGLMDNHYSLVVGSEMSGASEYVEEACRNTNQYDETGRSCWDAFEFYFEGYYRPSAFSRSRQTASDIFVPVVKPNDPERSLPSGVSHLAGPNDAYDPANAASTTDVDVASKVVFPRAVDPGSARTVYLEILDPGGNPVPKSEVELIRGSTPILQGQTSDRGRIYLLGALSSDGFRYQGSSARILGGKTSAVHRDWLSGEMEIPVENEITVEARPIAGDYPVVVRAVFEANGDLRYSLSGARPFPQTPGLELHADGATQGYSLTPGGSSYETTIPDLVGDNGIFTVNAVDDSSRAFFVDMTYTLTPADNPDDPRIKGPSGLAELRPGETQSSIQKVLLLSSRYPVRRDGLEESEIQAGDAWSVAIHPELSSGNDVGFTMAYDDDDLQLPDGTAADESQLRLFRWDEGGGRWEYIGGSVDTTYDWVGGVISESGTYAAFTTLRGVGIENPDTRTLPEGFRLHPNYPNPFNPTTTIRYEVPQTAHVSLALYDVLGRRVEVLADEQKAPGVYEVVLDASRLASGLYVYRMEADHFFEARSLVVLK